MLKQKFIKCKKEDCHRQGYIFKLDGPEGNGYYLSDIPDETSDIEKEYVQKLKMLDHECSIKTGSIEKITSLISGNNPVKPEKHHIICASINDRYDIISLMIPYIKNIYEINTKTMDIEVKINSRTRMYNRPHFPMILGEKYNKFIKDYENKENKTNSDLIKLKAELEKLKIESKLGSNLSELHI